MLWPSMGPMYSKPNASNSIPGVNSPLNDSSARFAIFSMPRPTPSRPSRKPSISFLILWTNSLVMVRDMKLEIAPTFSAMDISLSFRMTTRSLFRCPAWFSAS